MGILDALLSRWEIAPEGQTQAAQVPCTRGLWEESDGLLALLESIKFLLENVCRRHCYRWHGATPQI